MSYTIYMRYNPLQPKKVSKPNKEMIEFTDKNIDQINSRGTEVIINLIDEDDNESLRILEKKGVQKLPALLGKGISEPIQKVDKIKKFLLSNLKGKKSLPQKNGDEELRDYQWDILDMGDDNPDGEGKRNDAEIRARVEYETKKRTKKGHSLEKMQTADEIIAQQRRGRARQNKERRHAAPVKNDSDSDDDEQPRRGKSRRPERKNNMDPDPVDIINDMQANGEGDAQDNDLASKFWAGRGVGDVN